MNREKIIMLIEVNGIGLRELHTADEILERDIVGIGNGAHINIPLKHKGKIAKIIIKKQKEDFKNE